MLRTVILTLLVCTAPLAAQDWYAKAVKSVDATITPATAKPGETVTLRLTVELNPGFHTYPTVQADKKAENMVNTLTFPEGSPLIFVGTVQEPPQPEVKAEPLLGIKAMHVYSGSVVYERKAVVSPKAKAEDTTITLKLFSLQVCDEGSCYGPKKLTPAAKLTIKGDPVPVEKAYAAEVEKALAGK